VRTRCYHACRQRLRFTCSGRWLGWTCGMRQRIDHARRRLGGRYLARSLDGDGCARLGSKHQLCHRRTKTSVQEAGPGRPMAICRAITADYALLSAGGPRRWPALPQRRLIWSSSATCTCLGHDTAASTGQKGLFADEAGRPQARVRTLKRSSAGRDATVCILAIPCTCGVCVCHHTKRTPMPQRGACSASSNGY